ncbi:MAG: hypothetical protein A3K09_00435 [Nitrospinae bacterium RIFCSPLOWO2_12_FULL_47_7]|nr:MAG: hypothetical protein A3K09_00435 [Nitrospinae bacterium RIFCSPLOWO2_12_FULL_47_7]
MRILEKMISFLALFLILFSSTAVAQDLSPQECVKKLLDTIANIKTGDNISAEQKEKNKKQSDQAIVFLDLKDVSQQTLGKYWKERTPKEQEEFVALLSQLFKKIAFPNSSKFFADLKPNYGETRIDKNQAVVPLKMTHKNEGEVSIDFKLQLGEGKWRVYDVILDEVSMRNNLKSQFYKVLEKDDFPELVRRMKEKIEKGEG